MGCPRRAGHDGARRCPACASQAVGSSMTATKLAYHKPHTLLLRVACWLALSPWLERGGLSPAFCATLTPGYATIAFGLLQRSCVARRPAVFSARVRGCSTHPAGEAVQLRPRGPTCIVCARCLGSGSACHGTIRAASCRATSAPQDPREPPPSRRDPRRHGGYGNGDWLLCQ